MADWRFNGGGAASYNSRSAKERGKSISASKSERDIDTFRVRETAAKWLSTVSLYKYKRPRWLPLSAVFHARNETTPDSLSPNETKLSNASFFQPHSRAQSEKISANLKLEPTRRIAEFGYSLSAFFISPMPFHQLPDVASSVHFAFADCDIGGNRWKYPGIFVIVSREISEQSLKIIGKSRKIG